MSERELIYRISVAGQSEAKAAIRSIVQEANRAANEEAKATRMMVDTVLRERKRGAAGVKRIGDEESAYQARLDAFNLRNAAKNFRDLTREHAKSERDKTKAAEREAKQREADAKKAGARIVAEMNREVKDFEKAEKVKTKIAKQEADERARLAKHEAAQATAERRREHSRADRDARQFARDRAFEERRLLKGLATGMSEGVGSTLRYSYGLAARGVRDVASGLGMSRGWDIGNIASERASVGRLVRSLAIEARTPGTEFSFDEGGTKSALASVARKTGFTQEELGAGVMAASEKGSGATYATEKNLTSLAMEAKAIGTTPAELARFRETLRLKGMSEDQIKAFLGRANAVGKTGVFRASDLATQGEMMLASFGPGIAQAGADFLGFANQARLSTGSGAMARTAFDAALDTLDKKRDKIQGLGVKYEDGNGEARSKVDIIMDTIAAVGGDKTKLSKIFDPSRGGKAITTLVDAYQRAGDDTSGRAAMKTLIQGDESLKNATYADMMKDANAAIAESSNQTAIKMEELRQKISEKLLPVIDKLVDKLLRISESKMFSKSMDYVAENPIKSALLGGLVMGFGPTALRYAGNAAARYAAGSIVNTVPGFKGSGGAKGFGGGLGAMLGGGAGGATPVYVVNFPGGGGDTGGMLGGAGPGIGGGALGGELAADAAVGIGGASGAAIIGTMLAAALGVAIVGVLGDKAVEHGGKPPTTDREATDEDRKELAEGKKANRDRENWIDNFSAFGGSPDGDNATFWAKKKADQDAMKAKAGEDALAGPDLGMLDMRRPLVGPNGKPIDLKGGAPGSQEAADMKVFRGALKDVTKELGALAREARNRPAGGFSVYVQPPNR